MTSESAPADVLIPPTRSNPRIVLAPWIVPAAIILLTLLAYLPIFRAGFIWDDDRHITTNKLLHSVAGLRTMWLNRDALPQYYPLTHTVFWIEYHLWQDQPVGYHAVNLLIHAANAVFVWMLLRKLKIPGALLSALFFALHPMQVESAGWISERKNTLSAFFYLLSILSFFKSVDTNTNRWFSFSIFLFICSMLCKSVTCTMPAVLLLLIWWRDGRLTLEDFLELIPFFAIGLLLGLHTAWLERTHVGSAGPEWRFASTIPGEVIARCLIAGRNVWFYLWKILVPYPLMFEYPRWHINIASPIQYLFPIALIVALLCLFVLRHRISRGPLTAMLFFVGTLFPALGFANLYPMRFSFVADHFQYLACIGPLTLLAVGIYKLPSLVAQRTIAVVIVAVSSLLTFSRAVVFRDKAHLYADAVAKNPNAWMCQTNLGVILSEQHQWEPAVQHLLLGIKLHPINAAAADNLGQIALARKQDDAAQSWYEKAIAMEPNVGNPHYHLAGLLESHSDNEHALTEYQSAARLMPNNAPAHLNYGVILARLGRFADAADQFRETLRIDPSSPLPRKDLVAALEKSRQFPEAAEQIYALLAIQPNDATLYCHLGLVQMAMNHRGEAMAALSRSLEIDPTQAKARRAMDSLLAPDHPSASP